MYVHACKQVQMVQLKVVATDGASPAFSSVVDITIHVLDVNDNRPQFVLDPALGGALTFDLDIEEVEVGGGVLTVAVNPQLARGSVVAPLRAVDADAADNARLTYRLLPTPGCDDAAGYDVISGGGGGGGDVISVPAGRRRCGLFEVDRREGGLRLATGLTGLDDGTTMNVTVVAVDSGVPPRTGTVLVRVVVNGTVPLPSVPTQRRHGGGLDRWMAALMDDAVLIVCSLAVFVAVACCLCAVVLVLASRRARARQRRAARGYNCRAEEEKALEREDKARDGEDKALEQEKALELENKALEREEKALGGGTPAAGTAVVVYGSCEAPPRTVPACDWPDHQQVRSPRCQRNGFTTSLMT